MFKWNPPSAVRRQTIGLSLPLVLLLLLFLWPSNLKGVITRSMSQNHNESDSDRNNSSRTISRVSPSSIRPSSLGIILNAKRNLWWEPETLHDLLVTSSADQDHLLCFIKVHEMGWLGIRFVSLFANRLKEQRSIWRRPHRCHRRVTPLLNLSTQKKSLLQEEEQFNPSKCYNSNGPGDPHLGKIIYSQVTLKMLCKVFDWYNANIL